VSLRDIMTARVVSVEVDDHPTRGIHRSIRECGDAAEAFGTVFWGSN
jgi:hypothetical protein